MTKMNIDIERSVKATAKIFQSMFQTILTFLFFIVFVFCSSSGMIVIFVFLSSSSSMPVT